MKGPDRQEVAQLIGLPCMIKRERAGQAFFVSDYPQRLSAAALQAAESRLHQAGYLIQRQGQLALIDWQPARYLAFWQGLALPPDDIPLPGVGSLLRRHPAAPGDQDSALLAQALRLWLLGDRDRLHQLLEQGLAQALREGRPPPYHAIALLSTHSRG